MTNNVIGGVEPNVYSVHPKVPRGPFGQETLGAGAYLHGSYGRIIGADAAKDGVHLLFGVRAYPEFDSPGLITVLDAPYHHELTRTESVGGESLPEPRIPHVPYAWKAYHEAEDGPRPFLRKAHIGFVRLQPFQIYPVRRRVALDADGSLMWSE